MTVASNPGSKPFTIVLARITASLRVCRLWRRLSNFGSNRRDPFQASKYAKLTAPLPWLHGTSNRPSRAIAAPRNFGSVWENPPAEVSVHPAIPAKFSFRLYRTFWSDLASIPRMNPPPKCHRLRAIKSACDPNWIQLSVASYPGMPRLLLK
jgi:hypothetical protein